MPGPMIQGEKRKLTKQEKKEIYKGLSRYLPYFILVVFIEIASVVLAVIAPEYLSNLANEVAKPATTGLSIDMDVITQNGLILVGMYLGQAALQFAAAFIMTSISQYYAKALRQEIQGKINRLPLRYFDSNLYGDILSRLTNDVDTVSQALSNSLSSLVHAIFLLTGVVIAMFIKQWILALVVIASLPILALLLMLDLKLAAPQFRKRQNLISEISAQAEENYSGQLVIKCFEAEEKTVKKFDADNLKLSNALYTSETLGGFMGPISNFVSYLAYAAVALVAGLLIVDGSYGVSLGTITAFFVYVDQFQSPLSQISQALNNLQSGLAANARIIEFMSEKEDDQEVGKKEYFDVDGKEVVQGEVSFEHVFFGYDESRTIINDFSAEVKPGYKVALVGPTGAGKTTMVNLLMRFYEINSGDIKIDGVSIKDLSKKEIHEIFGMVLQDTWIFEGTLRENLVYNTPGVTDEQLNEVIKECHLRHYVKTLPGGLDYYINDPASISSGEKQLITIARAMLRNAPLLILDEATSNVDTRTEERIQEAMDRLTAGRTTFVIAHRLSTIKNANLILVLNQGEIVEQGTHESLMELNGFYASLYNSQFAFE